MLRHRGGAGKLRILRHKPEIPNLHHTPLPSRVDEGKRVIDTELQHALGGTDRIYGREQIGAVP